MVDEMNQCSQMRDLGPQNRIDHVGKTGDARGVSGWAFPRRRLRVRRLMWFDSQEDVQDHTQYRGQPHISPIQPIALGVSRLKSNTCPDATRLTLTSRTLRRGNGMYDELCPNKGGNLIITRGIPRKRLSCPEPRGRQTRPV